MGELGLIREEGSKWAKMTCIKCDNAVGYNLFLHEDYDGCILSVCKGCGKIYFLESHLE